MNWTLADYSNAQLDAAFANSFDARDYVAAEMYGAEIRARMLDVGSFIWGTVGMSEFPLYEKRSGTSQVDMAQSSVKDAIVAVPQTVGGAARDVVAGAAEIAKPVLDMFSPFVWGAIVVGGVVLYVTLRK